MSNLTDRTSYLRGLAEGMGLTKEQNESKLMLEMLAVMDEMAQKIAEFENDLDELGEYVESIDNDLSDMEEVLFDDEDEYDDDEYDSDMSFDGEELSFSCPHCGTPVQIKAEDIDFDESPVCSNCHKPFFPDVIDGEEENDD